MFGHCINEDDFLAELWHGPEKAWGFKTRKHSPESLPGWKAIPDLPSLQQTEHSPLFDTLRLNRKTQGAFRYGLLGAAGKKQYDRIADIRRRAALYEADGNLEHLVDISNIAELEFVEGTHPLRHMDSKDDAGHTVVKN